MDNEKFQGFIADQFAKMFNEFKDLKTDMSGLKTEVSGLKTDMSGLKTEVSGLKTEVLNLRASQVRMENKFDEQIKSLHDFRIRQEEINKDVISHLDRIEIKLETLQLETAHVRRAK